MPIQEDKYAKTKIRALRHRQEEEEKTWPLWQSPLRLLLLMAAAVFITETGVMALLAALPEIPAPAEALLDASVLILVISPLFYWLWFRPFDHHLRWRRRSEEEVRRLSQQLLRSTEEERRRLARDLHDELGQAMTALRGDLQDLQRSDEGGRRKELFNRVIDRVHELGRNLRDISTALRPEILEDLGIEAALRWHIGRFVGPGHGLQVDFRVVGFSQRPSPEIETVLFRVAQEALNNIVRHSGATRAEVLLTQVHPKIILTIRDNGSGFVWPATGRLGELRGVGLIGIRERTAAVGGKVAILTGEGRGTVLRAELPAIQEEIDEPDKSAAGG